MPLRGRSALVTGADGEIGHAIACALGAAGSAVVVHAGSGQGPSVAAVAAITGAGGAASSAYADLGDAGAVERLAVEAIRSFGAIDILVTVTTRSDHAPLAEIDERVWSLALDTDLRAPFLLGVVLGRQMRPGGIVLNVACRPGRRTPDALSAVIEAGLTTLSRALAAALAPAVRVYCVVCGAGDADRPQGAWPASTPPPHLDHGSDVASLALHLVSGRAAVASGTALAVT